GSPPRAPLFPYTTLFRSMLDGGADPHYVSRRLTRMAVEDIGLADPRALTLALDAWQAYDRLGPPEGELALGELVIYLALAPKSRSEEHTSELQSRRDLVC